MRPCSLLFLFLVLTASCSRKACIDGQPYVRFENFDAADFSLLQITAYERGSAFGKIDRVFYAGSVVKNFSEDSVRIPLDLDLSHDYEIRFVDKGFVYRVHELFFFQKDFKDGLGGKPRSCINELAYTINTKRLKAPMRMTGADPVEPKAYIIIDKKEKY